MKVLFLCIILTSTVLTGSIWSFLLPHRAAIELEEEISHVTTKVSVLQHHDSGFTFNKFKNTKSFQDYVTEVIVAVGKAGEKMINVIQQAESKMGKIKGVVSVGDSTLRTLKDSLVKMEEWDPIDSSKRIGEDIRDNASIKIRQGVEEVKEIAEKVMETSPNELVSRSKSAISDGLLMVLSRGSVISWCRLLGFSTAYGSGVWVTFFSSLFWANICLNCSVR
ncbi:hypothetical protein R6Q59_035820 [Mikania micrantha]